MHGRQISRRHLPIKGVIKFARTIAPAWYLERSVTVLARQWELRSRPHCFDSWQVRDSLLKLLPETYAMRRIPI